MAWPRLYEAAARATKSELLRASEWLQAMPKRFTESLQALRDEVEMLQKEKLSLELAKQQRGFKVYTYLGSVRDRVVLSMLHVHCTFVARQYRIGRWVSPSMVAAGGFAVLGNAYLVSGFCLMRRRLEQGKTVKQTKKKHFLQSKA